MENLISLVNKIQRACTALGDYGEATALPTLWDSLPAIAVVGGQSSGKSSVLESIVGKDFLPRGSGIVTRRPLVLQLHKGEEGSKEYAEFLHLPRKRFTDFAAVRKEIQDETDRETGKTKQISSVPIHLSIYSPYVVNLTLIDLPGLTKVAVEGQPDSIVQDIENMVRSYIEKPNCIILAISPANQDLATSDAIKISREVDPTGERTFGVLTKIDLMDKGTDAVEMLEGRAFRLKYPWIGVVNRSQADINKNVDMIAARRREREYFSSTPEYKHLAHRMGSEYLAKVLSKHLEAVIKSKIPGIQSLISKTIAELEAELSRLGKPIAADDGGKLYAIMEICRSFDQIFKEHLDGVRPGGDRIYNVFDNQLPAALKRLQFDKQLSMENIKKLITEADGYQPHLIAPEQGYRRLIESSLITIKGPAEAAVDAVHSLLKDLVHKSISETLDLKQYPSLRAEVGNAAIDSLEKMRDESKKATLQLVDMECGYLTVDFFRKLPQDIDKGGNPTHSIFDRYNDSYLRRIGSNVLSYVGMVCATLRHLIPKSIVHCQPKRLSSLLNEDPAVMERRSALRKRLELYRSAQAEIDSVAWSKYRINLISIHSLQFGFLTVTDAIQGDFYYIRDNPNHRKSVAASLVQGVYVLEKDRQERREGTDALASPWWVFFNFQLLHKLVDDVDSSIFGAIYEFKPPSTYCNDTLHRSPSYVIAFRGTITKADSVSRDIELDMHFVRNGLHQTSRYEIAIQAVRNMIATVGDSGIWLAGHSLGSAVSLLCGKTMAKSGNFIESFLFNPPYVSAPIERIKDKKVKHGLRIAGSVITAGLTLAVKAKQKKSLSSDPFAAFSAWVPCLFVNPSDHICSEYIGYFEHRKKMEEIGAGSIERLATQNSLGCLLMGAFGKESEPLHLIPSASVTVNLTPSRDFKEAHGIHQWWKPHLHLQSKLYKY
ncbi:hypothetical protein Ahy_B05g078854 isoform C [Arachis hypogaea]|uniref:Dynamin-type G domain-containing protein n=1 Tax=Arachis hypogaea TaxID=3818 RepID=A0A444Z8B2_ARAHY|nr:hypothetical protein Ahy_B05g078854 isoform C [Arachis hypogaea]